MTRVHVFSRQTLLKRSWLESLQVKALLNSALLQKLQDSQVGETATSIVVVVPIDKHPPPNSHIIPKTE